MKLSDTLLVLPTALFIGAISITNIHISKEKSENSVESIESLIERSSFEIPKITESPTPLKSRDAKCLTECQLIAEAIVYEARSESDSGKLKVASVILNRVDHTRFPNSIKKVIYQPYQFSYINDMHLQTTPTDYDWEIAYDIANEALDGNRNTEALFYLNPKKVKKLPKWALVYFYLYEYFCCNMDSSRSNILTRINCFSSIIRSVRFSKKTMS